MHVEQEFHCHFQIIIVKVLNRKRWEQKRNGKRDKLTHVIQHPMSTFKRDIEMDCFLSNLQVLNDFLRVTGRNKCQLDRKWTWSGGCRARLIKRGRSNSAEATSHSIPYTPSS